MSFPKIDFPKGLDKNIFFVEMVVFYFLFSFQPENYLPDEVDFYFFNNDFREPGLLVWFFQALVMQGFILLITRTGTILIQDRLIKSIFYSLFIDSIFSILNTIFFGYYVSEVSLIVRNVAVILAMIYAYFVLYNETQND
jgi:hypothetical protein